MRAVFVVSFALVIFAGPLKAGELEDLQSRVDELELRVDSLEGRNDFSRAWKGHAGSLQLKLESDRYWKRQTDETKKDLAAGKVSRGVPFYTDGPLGQLGSTPQR